jgi:uncharacterized protein YjbI with pentapeptide repeats
MKDMLIENQVFKGINFNKNKIGKGTYEDCTFVNCVFNGSDVSGIIFVSCLFDQCDLSLMNTSGTAFREVKFKGCKMLGIHFEECNLFLLAMYFNNCQMNLSSFYKLKLKKTIFRNCSLQEVDFAEADLTSAIFDNCDLSGAMFERTVLEKADLSTAYNYTFDPETNRIKKAKFSQAGLGGLLGKYDILIER